MLSKKICCKFKILQEHKHEQTGGQVALFVLKKAGVLTIPVAINNGLCNNSIEEEFLLQINVNGKNQKQIVWKSVNVH